MPSEPRAILLPDHLPEQAFFFHEPVATFASDAGDADWSRLDDYLSSRTIKERWDDPVPPGALVGGFTYEGGYYFEAYEQVEVVPRDACLPQTVAKAVDQTGSVQWKEAVSREQYGKMVRAAQRYIEAGDIYQVNLARSFEAEMAGLDANEFFKFLYWGTQAPLGGMIPFKQDGIEVQVCSSSPELFLRIDGREISTRPIKGTRPRDRDPERDRQNAFELRTCSKEIAELVMITDLERNDLGRICKYGSVQVPELLQAEAFSHVHHLVSTVTGQLKEGVSTVEAVRKCFPGGSITGAPKRRSMEIIRELELEPRGIYTGAMGYFGFDGTAQFNIAIRTCEIAGNRIKFFTGSGITWGSDPDQEFDETCHKATGMMEAAGAYAANLKGQLQAKCRPTL